MNTQYFKKLATFSLFLWTIQVSPAYAYLDPGTGSLLLQGLLGGIAGIAVFGKIYWHKFTSWLGHKRNQDDK